MSELPASADLVVVGAGTAGAVIAGRLAERGDRSIVVLEAGPDPGPAGHERWPQDILDGARVAESCGWGYQGPGAAGQTLDFERARIAWSCSSHNGSAQGAGWRGDYDRWAAAGLEGWDGEAMGAALGRAAERMRVRRLEGEEVNPFQRAFCAAASAVVPERDDMLDIDGGPSVSQCPVNITPEGTRWNAAFAYLDPVREQPQLTVVGECKAARVLVQGRRATGVEVISGGEERRIATGEVVVAAGAYGSPELLQRSGIGAAEPLAALGLRVLEDRSSVGANLHDHATLELCFGLATAPAAELDQAEGSGWMRDEGAIAKLRSGLAQGPYDLHVFPWVERDRRSPTGWIATVPIGLLTPRWRGHVAIATTDPGAIARPDHAYLSEDADCDALLSGLEALEPLLAGPGLRPMLGEPLHPPVPADRSGRRSWLRATHGHYWHPGGSCRMGAGSDPGAVTDDAGRVHGTEGLRVCDASLFPELPRSTPALPVVAVGEVIAAKMGA